jgi:hypothetical protein
VQLMRNAGEHQRAPRIRRLCDVSCHASSLPPGQHDCQWG